MKFLKLDKKKGSGGPSIKSRYAYLIRIAELAYLPPTNEKGVRLEGDILLKEDCTMMPLYLTSTSQEFSYDTLGDDDEKSYMVKFSGNHPGTELEALEFAKNMIEEPFLVLIPSCNELEPWKLLGEITNPLIFTSSHKAGKDSSKFTFNFEQRIGSEFIYFSYGGVEVPSDEGGGIDPPSGGFDPTKWARIDASNIDDHIAAWREKLGISLVDRVIQIGPVTATTTTIDLALHSSNENKFLKDGQILIKTVANHWDFPEVTFEQVFTIYVINDPDIVHLAMDGEEIPVGALIVRTLTISADGIIIEDSDDVYSASQAWRNFTITTTDSFTIAMGNSLASSFRIKSTVANPKIGLISQKVGKILKEGFGFWIFNDSANPLELVAETYTDTEFFKFKTFEPYVIPAQKWVYVKILEDVLVVAKLSTEVDLTPYATNTALAAEAATRLANDNSEITARQNADIAEANARTFQDGLLDGKITTEKNRNDTQDSSITDLYIHQITIVTTTSINTNTLGAIISGGTNNILQHGRNVKISNGVNAINITCETTSASAFVASYTKLGGAAITFTAGIGATLVQVDGTNILNGIVGSTACLTRSGNTFYLQISNR